MKTALLPLGLSVFAAPLAGQTPLVESGDVVPGAGTVFYPYPAAINDAGDWAASVLVTGITEYESVLLRNGAVLLFEGDPMAGPPGATLDFVNVWVSLNQAGELVWPATLAVPGLPTYLTALGFEGQTFVWAGMPGGMPCSAAGVGAGTTYQGVGIPLLNDFRRVLTAGTIHDPTSLDPAKLVLLRFDLDATGALVGETILLKEGAPLASGTMDGFYSMAFNNAGDYLVSVRLSGTPNDGAVVLNGVPLAEVGGPAPGGATWKKFDDGVALNDQGDHAYAGTTTAGALIVRNGAKFLAAGDPLPGLAPYVLVELRSVFGIELAGDGTVVWVGTWNAPVNNSGLFLDDHLLIREGVTQIGGKVVAKVGGAQIAPGGELLSVQLTFTDGSTGDYRFDVSGGVADLPGCFGNAGVLAVVSGDPEAGGVLSVALDQGQAPGVSMFLAFSLAPATGGPCGIPVAGMGELLISVVPPNPIFVGGGATWLGAPLAFQMEVPLLLYGETLYTQGLFVDLAHLAPGEPFRLTNAAQLAVGI